MKTVITLVAACLSFPAAVAAQQAVTPEEETGEGIPATEHQEEATREVVSSDFNKLDEDGDGAISRQEGQAKSELSANWNNIDRDGDGQLNPEEFAEFEQTAQVQEGAAETGTTAETREEMPVTRHQEQAVEDDLVSELDQDGDGRISQQEAEAEAQLSENWDRLDENGDGMLDARELDQFEEMLSDTEEAE